ncbi:MAG: hypothetical protein GXO22_04495 [Aquificae bacterium]|nr:hypothetical protein [Aquificota bacterium]
MDNDEFTEEIKKIISKVFSIELKEDSQLILKELVETYKMYGSTAGSPLAGLVDSVENPTLQIRKIFKGKNQKDEEVLLIYFEEAHGIILNLTNPSKSQIGTLPILKL